MSLATLILLLILAGVILALIPLDQTIRNIILVIVVIIAVVVVEEHLGVKL